MEDHSFIVAIHVWYVPHEVRTRPEHARIRNTFVTGGTLLYRRRRHAWMNTSLGDDVIEGIHLTNHGVVG